jgi:hypothetical protein
MKTYTSSINELIKDLYKEDTIAKFSKYRAGELFYQFILKGETYEFSIDTVEIKDLFDTGYKTLTLSDDLGTTTFEAEIKASLLSRYIQKRATISELYKL